MSEDNSHATPKTEADEKSEKVSAPPIHRQFTSTHLGSGVAVIVIAEVLLHDDVHTFGFKAILTLGILWLSYWVYAELRFRGKVSRALAAAIALTLISASFALAFLAYAPLGNEQPSKRRDNVAQVAPPPTTPAYRLQVPTASPSATSASQPTVVTPLAGIAAYSQISPKEICDQVDKTLPFQQDAVEKGFVGTPVRWKLWLTGINNFDGKIYASFTCSTERYASPSISALIEENDIQYLKAAKERDRFDVAGTIKYVDSIHVGIDKARILPAN